MVRWQQILYMLPGFVFGLTVHECAHALSARLLGDGYPASQGRVSLNPFRHLSPLGSVAIALLGFGWARPVEVNPYNFKNPRRDFLLTALAGPASNIIVMLVLSIFLRIVGIESYGVMMVIVMGAYINGILAVINLLPVPPLDGSRIWPVVFPRLKLASSSRFNLLWIILLIAVLRLNLLNGLYSAVLAVITALSGLS